MIAQHLLGMSEADTMLAQAKTDSVMSVVCLNQPRLQHVFDFQELFHAVVGTFAAMSGFLDSAKRCHLGGKQAGIDANNAIF
jgi:hypothetical protein